MYSTGYLTRNVQVENAVWHCPGFGPIPTAGLNWGDPSCTCFNAHFAVDPFGRTFFPDPFRGSVEVIDTNGNHLLRIGKYGNPDDARPGSTGTDIRFGWPGFVSQARGTIYVSDCVNRQVAVVGITYDETAEIPIGQ